ncbi:MAG: HEAT repeat domain-containing protein [Planctomycetes bacterium]|nr:HEAT repeat domain-containing protein [Planctomycetota bacterium]
MPSAVKSRSIRWSAVAALALLAACSQAPVPAPGPSASDEKVRAQLEELQKRVAALEARPAGPVPAEAAPAAAVDGLLEMLRSTDPEVVAPAAQLARRLPTSERTAALIELARDTARDRKLREPALDALGGLKQPAALDALAALLKDPDEQVVARAARALAEARRASDFAAILEAYAALNAPPPSGPAGIARAGLLEALRKLGDRRATPLLLEILNAPNTELQAHAALTLRELRDPEAVPGIAEWLRKHAPAPDRPADAAVMAVQALAAAEDPRAGPVVLELARGPHAQLRAAALSALPSVSGPDLAAPLLSFLNEVAAKGDPRDSRMELLLRALARTKSPDTVALLLAWMERHLTEPLQPVAQQTLEAVALPAHAQALADTHAASKNSFLRSALEQLLRNGNFGVEYEAASQRFKLRGGAPAVPPAPAPEGGKTGAPEKPPAAPKQEPF